MEIELIEDDSRQGFREIIIITLCMLVLILGFIYARDISACNEYWSNLINNSILISVGNASYIITP